SSAHSSSGPPPRRERRAVPRTERGPSSSTASSTSSTATAAPIATLRPVLLLVPVVVPVSVPAGSFGRFAPGAGAAELVPPVSVGWLAAPVSSSPEPGVETRLYAGTEVARPVGVGSKRTQPAPEK